MVGGSHSYIDKLTAPYADRILTSHPVTQVTRRDGKVQVIRKGEEHEFDAVIFACHADEALEILIDATAAEQAALGDFPYQKNVAYLHRDAAQMPKDACNWSSWNYLSQPAQPEHCTVTYWMNNLQGIDKNCPLFVTLNPLTPIAVDKIFDVHTFMHPVFTAAAVTAQSKIATLQGQQNTWFCGAHLSYGFHEDGLQSAIRVVEAMGVTIPWR